MQTYARIFPYDVCTTHATRSKKVKLMTFIGKATELHVRVVDRPYSMHTLLPRVIHCYLRQSPRTARINISIKDKQVL